MQRVLNSVREASGGGRREAVIEARHFLEESVSKLTHLQVSRDVLLLVWLRVVAFARLQARIVTFLLPHLVKLPIIVSNQLLVLLLALLQVFAVEFGMNSQIIAELTHLFIPVKHARRLENVSWRVHLKLLVSIVIFTCVGPTQ